MLKILIDEHKSFCQVMKRSKPSITQELRIKINESIKLIFNSRLVNSNQVAKHPLN